MIHTENEIEIIAIKILRDVKWTYNESNSPRAIFKSIDYQIEEVSTQKKHPRFNEYVAMLFEYWLVFFDFPEDDNWKGRNIMTVKIKDKTGEPYEIGHRQYKGKVVKNAQGKYEIEDY
jgi:hypothetical protein